MSASTTRVIPVGDGILIVVPRQLERSEQEMIQNAWQLHFPNIPMMVIGGAEWMDYTGFVPVQSSGYINYKYDASPAELDGIRQWWKDRQK